MTERFPPIHPGEILTEEFLKPMAISQYRLARSINPGFAFDHHICYAAVDREWSSGESRFGTIAVDLEVIWEMSDER